MVFKFSVNLTRNHNIHFYHIKFKVLMALCYNVAYLVLFIVTLNKALYEVREQSVI